MVSAINILLFCLFITGHVQSNNYVPGKMLVKLLPDNQITNLTYTAYAKARFVVLFDGVPLTADEKQGEVLFGVEIRGWRPASGPRGYIATAFNTTTLEDFTENYRNVGEFTFTPDVFPGYFWFFRPFLTFSKFNVVSTNFMTAAASESFHVQGFPMRCS